MLYLIMRFIFLFLFICFPILSWSSNNNLRVEVLGLSSEEKEIVLSNLSIKNAEQIKPGKGRIVSYYQLALQEITTTLESLGYYHPNIQGELFETPSGFLATYHIEPGIPIIIKNVYIKLVGEGEKEPTLLALIKNTPLKPGKKLKHKSYETFKQNLLGKALQLGFLDAVFILNEVKVKLENHEADIFLELDTGNQYAFGKVRFAAPPYPTEFLSRYLPFKEGDPYTTEQLICLQKAFIDTDLFTKVRIDPDLNNTKNLLVPLTIRLTPKPHNKYTSSIGFGTDTGLRGMLGWERRRIAYPGHRININVKGSKRLNQANLQYSIPGKRPTTDRLAAGLQITEEKLVDKKYSLVSEPGITHLQKRGHLEQILSLRYLNIIARKIPSLPKTRTHFLMPSIGYAWSTIHKETLLQHGARITFNIQGGLKTVLCSTDFLQAETRAKWILPIGEMTRFIIRTDVGAIATPHFNVVPWTLRYFTGGDHTVRGFGYNSIGPRELDPATGEFIRVGGRYLIVGSLELERKIYKNFGAAIFVDTGNAMNKWRSRLSTGAGFGLRYATPLGPLRLDLARPMMRGKQKLRIHLTFGMDL